MDEKLQTALKYLSTPVGSFWKWMDGGKVVVWTHGATIAFREEVATVLQRLAPRGLPPFDSVLMVIAATRIYWVEDSASLRQKLLSAVPLCNMPELPTQLNRIHNLPADLIHPVSAKADLAEVVFETVRPVVTGEIAKIVCEILTSGMVREYMYIPNLPRLRGGSVQTSKSLFRELSALERGLAGISEQSLRLRHQTGLDEQPLPADVIVPAEPVAIRSLLQELALDDELCGMTRIARNLSAVLHLPRAVSDSDEMPLGGISDISNRGTLDRLLLSELAHDDLMLATRVALNEALYLRRETPPSPPPQRRHLLLDSGLRMWGVPRVYAAATMLSLAATEAEGATLLAYRAAGDQVIPIDLSTREGLVAHLEALEPDVHPGRSLSEFFQVVADDSQPGDIVIVTSDAALTDPEFQRALAESVTVPCYLTTVNREGEFQLWSRGIRGTKLLTSLKLDLDELLKPPARAHVRLVDSKIDADQPAIFRVSPFPIRLPHMRLHQDDKEPVWSVRLPGDISTKQQVAPGPALGSMIVTRDHRLLLFDSQARGAMQIAAGVPLGKVLWSGLSVNSSLSYAIIYHPGEPALYRLIVVANRIVTCSKLPSLYLTHGVEVLGATCHSLQLFVIFSTRIESFDTETGVLLHQLHVPEQFKWSGGRFFEDANAAPYEEWRTLTCDGNDLQFEPIRLRGPELTGRLLRLFDREGHDGPFGVHLRGSIANLSDQTEWEWGTNPRANPAVLDIDDSGDRVLIEQDADDWKGGAPTGRRRIRQVIFISARKVVEVSLSISSLAMWDLTRMNLGGTLMRRFGRIFVGPTGKLTLTSKSHTNRELVAENHRLVWNQVPPGPAQRAVVSFEQARHPDHGCTMTVATWQDGSRAFIDSRGLLHLQSSDRSIAEATLVLTDRDVAGWASNGRVCGTRYYVDESAGTICSPQEFIDDVLNPFIERLH